VRTGSTVPRCSRAQFIEQLFRRTEARGIHSMTATPGSAGSIAKTLPMQRFDLDVWLAQYNTTPDT
jgi:hypothetical protein